jgi:type VI secretion system protein ImpM
MGLAFWRQDTSAAATGYCLFGKLPRRADFLRVNATAPVAHEYDQLLAKTITSLAQDPGWETAYDITAATLFAYRGRDRQSWLFGGQCPSNDQQGRRFPLVGGITLSTAKIGANLPLVPLAYEVFYSGLVGHLENAVTNSVDAVTLRSFLEGVADADTRIESDFELSDRLLRQFTATHTANDLLTILRCAYPHASLEQALLNIAFYANFLRHFPQAATAQEIVLPLPADLGTAALAASAWLRLIGGLAGDARRICGFFFRRDVLIVGIDLFSDNFSPLLPLIHSAKGRGLMLTSELEAWRAHPFYPEIRYALKRLIAEPNVPLQAVFECAEQIGSRLLSSE